MKRGVFLAILLFILPITHAQIQGGIYPYKCYDGIQDGDETGVDCGGSCPPCGFSVEGLLQGGVTSLVWMVAIILVALLFFGILLFLLSRIKKKRQVEEKVLPPTGIAKELEITIELQQYIQNLLQQGYTNEQIRQWLLQHGYDDAHIQEAFSRIQPPSQF